MQTATKTSRGRPRDEALPTRRREEILDVAATLFAQHGYSSTTTQLLADHLQVGKGTIYRYFPTKRDLFLGAVDRLMHRLLETIQAAADPIEDPLDKMVQGIGTYLTFFAEHPEFAELIIQERAEFKDRKKPTYFEHRDANSERHREFFRQLIADGRVREDVPVDRVNDVLGDLVYGTMFTNYFTGRSRSAADQAHDILDVIFHGILSDSERRRRIAKGSNGQADSQSPVRPEGSP